MRIPIPQRFSWRAITIFAMFVFFGQQIEGTDLVFSILTGAFICIWGLAFNMAGGIEYPSGAFIFFNGLLTVVLGLTIKIFLFQPGERNLLAPRVTMAAYCCAMAGMAVAALFTSGLRSKQALLKDIASMEELKNGTFVCFVLAVVVTIGASATASTGSLVSALNQVNRFPIMAIIMGTTYQIQRSQGKSSTNWIVWSSMILNSAFGLIYFSKEGILLGPTTWLITAALHGFSFRKVHVLICAVGFAFTIYYLVPYSQYVRNFGSASRTQNIATAIHYLSDLNGTRETYIEAIDEVDIKDEPHLFDKREGFLDRLIILPSDDALVRITLDGKVFGLEPTYVAYANIVPHFMWPNKPDLNAGNAYAHELGLLAEDDESTGVSFSPMGDAFHQAKWLGLVLVPITCFVGFLVIDSLVGTSRYSIWAILPIIEVAHLAPEGGIGTAVYLCGHLVIAILLLYFVIKKATPFAVRTFLRSGSPTGTVGPMRKPMPLPEAGGSPG